MREGVRTARETAPHSACLGVQYPAQAGIGLDLEAGVVVVLQLAAERERQIASQCDLILQEAAV